jgi:hypothetical protein
MEKINFIPEKIYYLEITDSQNLEDVVLDETNHPKFINLNIDIDDTISNVKVKLEETLGKELEYGNACLDYIDDRGEEQLLNTSFYDLTGEYDYNVFKNIVLVTGNEMNNL